MAIIDKPSDFFNTVLYTGNATQRTIDVGFKPDFVWGKLRSTTGNHWLWDIMRGVNYYLKSNATDGNNTGGSDDLNGFVSNGFTVGNGSRMNTNNGTMVSWSWKAGTSFTNDASGTGIGTLDSTANVNTDVGISILKWTGNDANATVAHGLGAVPAVFIVKNLANGSTGWYMYHKSLGNTKHILLNSSAVLVDDINWNDTSPTSTVISLGGQTGSNGPSNSMEAYCFAEKQNYSKFSSYIGNGNANGPFIYTGFKPAFILIKGAISGAGNAGQNWELYDNKRLGYNVDNNNLSPNTNGAESTGDRLDIVSNGFKIRVNSDGVNDNNSTYIYMAFAENPFVTSTGNGSIPTTAR